jgi:plasmid stabilization system protein ParE
MNYTVVWRPTAERTLAEIWTAAVDRQAIADAADLIDAMLGSSPQEVGETRAGDTRILTVMPLSIYYDIHSDDRLVAIWAVWQVPGPR